LAAAPEVYDYAACRQPSLKSVFKMRRTWTRRPNRLTPPKMTRSDTWLGAFLQFRHHGPEWAEPARTVQTIPTPPETKQGWYPASV